MKKEMSSFDVRSIATEMASLTDAHMDKVFQWGNNVLFRINVQGQGKRELFFKDKKWLFLPANKPETPILSQSFATFLRKYIDNARIGNVRQVGFDRVIVMELLKADAEYDLIFEMFGGGNILLVLDGKILNCLIQKTMRDRSVRPGEAYVIPKSRFDPTSSTFEDFVSAVKDSASDLVRTLATGANLGGQYAEEICKRSDMDKNTKSYELSDEDVKKLYDVMREIVTRVLESPEPTVYSNGDEIIDVAPVKLAIYDQYTSERFETMSCALDRLISSLKEAEEEDYTDPEMDKLQRRIDRQTETIEEYRTEAEDLRKRADLIYANYQPVNELLTVLSEQSRKITWDKLAEGAMKIPYVSSIDPSKNTVTAIFDKTSVTLDYTKAIDANASSIYQQGKDLNEKALRADEALRDSKEALEKKRKGFIKAKIEMSNKVQPTKQFWFERYKWFITTSGKMVIAGRDAHTNDNIVKKHLKDEDLYAHADMHGAPSTILKEGRDATPEDLRETCLFALAQSKAWVAALSDGSAYWVYTDQVSKTPQAGEFVPRGAFIIRGKRNYEHHLPMELAIGEIQYQNTRKVMCGPVESVTRLSSKYYVIHPGRGKAAKSTALMAKELQVPEEEIARIIPPGDAEIVRRVWPTETSEE
ncbi:MAG: ribosome rescue protein RqcH [Candidatus Methanomethylophilaceae archaeon]